MRTESNDAVWRNATWGTGLLTLLALGAFLSQGHTDKLLPTVLHAVLVITSVSFFAASLTRYRAAVNPPPHDIEPVASEPPELLQTEAALQTSQRQFRQVLGAMREGFAICEIVHDQPGQPADFAFREINSAFTKLTNLDWKDITIASARELMPGVPQRLFEQVCRTGITGEPAQFTFGPPALTTVVEVRAFHLRPGWFALIGEDVAVRQERNTDREFLSAILAAIDDRIVIKDLQQRIIAANQAYAEAVGASSHHELLGRTDADIFSNNAGVARVRSYAADEIAAHFLKPGEVIEREDECDTADTRQVFFTRIFPIFSSDSKVVATLSFSHDITRRRMLEDTLRQNEARLHQALSLTKLGSFVHNLQTRERVWSKELYELHGLNPAGPAPNLDELLAAVHPDDRDRVAAHFRSSQNTRLSPPNDFRINTPDGLKHLHHEYFFDTDAATGQAIVVGVVQDITQFREAELKLAELNEQLTAINDELLQANQELLQRNAELQEARAYAEEQAQHFELTMSSARIGVWDWDVTEDLLRVNDVMLQALGYEETTPLELSSQQWQHRVHPEDMPVVKQLLSTRSAGGNGLRCAELRLQHSNGAWRWHACRGQIVQWDSKGQPLRIVGTLVDIEHQRQAESQLCQAQKLAAIGTLAGGIAHDFNNILFTISGNADMAGLRLEPDAPAQRNIEEITTASQRAGQLVKQLLAFARAEQPYYELTDPTETMSNVVEFLKPMLPANISLEVNFMASGERINCTATNLHEVMLNLCMNALQALEPAGGGLKVEAGIVELTTDTDLQQLPNLHPGRYMRLTVTDTGVGIDPAELLRIFDPYYTTRDAGEGRGLGLAVVHGIVTAHDGEITVSSNLGQGSVFTVYLPVVDAPTAKVPTERLTGGTESILLASGDERLVMLVDAMLSRLGYQVTLATDSSQAMLLLGADPTQFDLVLAAPELPGLSGAELVQRVRELYPELRIILCAGFDPLPASQALIAYGAHACLLQPLDLPQLARSVRSVLDGK